MHIRWKRQDLKGKPHLNSKCPHTKATTLLSPILVEHVANKQRTVWRVGPGIRQCCIKAKTATALASWWLEIDIRFAELEHIGLDDAELTEQILSSEEEIRDLLRQVVPFAPQAATAKAVAAFQQGQLRRRTQSLMHPHLRKLGINEVPTLTELQQIWRALAKKLHPDNRESGSQTKFVEAQASYQRLAAFLESQTS